MEVTAEHKVTGIRLGHRLFGPGFMLSMAPRPNPFWSCAVPSHPPVSLFVHLSIEHLGKKLIVGHERLVR